jgi:predicted nucleotidyltransferase component of viral defense system
MTLSLEEVRRRILIAMFSDDQLMDALVLKGGNAITLVYQIGDRSSVDMDFSMAERFSNLEDARRRVFTALGREFGSVGYVIFDESFVAKPAQSGGQQPEWWGGYLVEFKLAERSIFEKHKKDLDALRRFAAVLGPQQRRKYSIDISKYEFCDAKIKAEVDDYTIYVYSPEMIVIEKIRAICQQMNDYTITRHKTPRARDFYDIFKVIIERDIDLTTKENLSLFRAIFDAKQVPLKLLGQVGDCRQFHEPDWPAVEASISGTHEPFEFYFNFVVDLVLTLKTLWVE